MSPLVPRVTFISSILLASVLLHLGLLGLILWAERRGLTTAETEAIAVELVKQSDIPQPAKSEPPPKLDPPKPEPQKPVEQQPPKPDAPAQATPKPPEPPPAKTAAAPPPNKPPLPAPEDNPVQPAGPSGGPASESKSKLTPDEIAAFRAQVQKCWTLPVGLPNAMKLEAVLRVSLARNGAIAAGPELLRANALADGPVLVGIAMKALRECAPYRGLPAAKYSEWKVLDLRFLATGMTGLGSAKPPLVPRPAG